MVLLLKSMSSLVWDTALRVLRVREGSSGSLSLMIMMMGHAALPVATSRHKTVSASRKGCGKWADHGVEKSRIVIP